MEPVDLMSRTPGGDEDATAPHAPMLLNVSDPVTGRSRKRTHAVPLERAIGPGRTKRQSSAHRPRRDSLSKQAAAPSPKRARSEREGIPEARIEATEVAESEEPGLAEAPLEVYARHAGALDAPIGDARRRTRVAIISARLAYRLGWRKTPRGHARGRRFLPSWMWTGLNVLAIILFAQVIIMSEVDSSAINKAVNPLFQAFAGALPDTFYTAGPTPRPVSTESAFVATMLPYARHASQTLGWPVSVILAQWGVEHGWALPDFDGWNVGNTKAFNSPTGVCYGAPVVRGFCAPKTPGAGLAIYIHGAQLHYYTGIAAAARQGGPDAAARALGQSPWDAGHYTTDNSPGDSLLRAMKAFNLYRYDTP